MQTGQKTYPVFEEFEQLAKQFDLVPVCRRLLADSITPVSAFRLLDDGISSGCLFESVIGGERVGRYSFIATAPEARYAAWGNRTLYKTADSQTETTEADPLKVIEGKLSQRTVARLTVCRHSLVGQSGTWHMMSFVMSSDCPMLHRTIGTFPISTLASTIIWSYSTTSPRR